MILFVDNIADLLQVSNMTVITLECNHGLMDVIRWIESGCFPLHDFSIVGLMIGRGDLDRSWNWFAACLDELIAVIRRLNARVLLLLGAVLPSILDDRFMVREFVARNGIIQNRCFSARNRSLVKYTRPGCVLLTKGGPIATYFDKEGRLSVKGRERL